MKNRLFSWLSVSLLLSVTGGAVLWIAFTETLHATSTNAFCYSCHQSSDTIVQEYQASTHFRSQSGVVATCADCHIPKAFIPLVKTKVVALKDVYLHFTDAITLENFEQQRQRLAEHVWEEMEQNDSQTCRSCHNVEQWDLSLQSAKAQQEHNLEFWQANNKTCINCHKGIAHLLPLRPGTLVPKASPEL